MSEDDSDWSAFDSTTGHRILAFLGASQRWPERSCLWVCARQNSCCVVAWIASEESEAIVMCPLRLPGLLVSADQSDCALTFGKVWQEDLSASIYMLFHFFSSS